MSFDREHAVIGALLKKPTAIDEIDIVVDDFEVESYKLIFQSIIDLMAQSRAVDIITVSAELDKTNPGENWIALVGQPMKDCVSTANISGWAKLLKADSRNRKTKALCADVLNKLDTEHDSEVLVDDMVRQLMELSSTRQNYEHSISQALAKAVEMIEKATESDGPVGIPSGISKLDEVLGGFHNSDLYVVAARPSIGKTSVLLNIANAHQEQCGIVSAEQPADQVATRLIAVNGRINLQHMRTGAMEDADYTRLTGAVSKLHSNNNIWINDKSGINILDLIRQARKWKHQHNIKALYIDYIQRIKWTDQRIAKWEQVGNVVCALKELARDLDIPVIALAQVNRDVEKRPDKRPSMGDIANSSEIEKEADTIITLYRDEVYNEDSPDKGIMEFIVCKNRHGPTGFVRTVWLGKYTKIENFAPEYADH